MNNNRQIIEIQKSHPITGKKCVIDKRKLVKDTVELMAHFLEISLSIFFVGILLRL